MKGRSPPPLPRPRLAVIGDVHWRSVPSHPIHDVLKHVRSMDVDGVLLVGDLAGGHLRRGNRDQPDVLADYHGRVSACFEAVETLGVPFLWVPGNHDLPELGRGGAGRSYPGNVDGSMDELAGLRVAGIGGAGPHRFGFCYEWSDAEIRAREVPDCDVLLCHAPPLGTPLDATLSGEHVGSAAIRERALRHRGALVCGHIHEAPGAIQLQDCLVVNAGGLGAPYGRRRVAYLGGLDQALVFDLEEGTWEHLERAA